VSDLFFRRTEHGGTEKEKKSLFRFPFYRSPIKKNLQLRGQLLIFTRFPIKLNSGKGIFRDSTAIRCKGKEKPPNPQRGNSFIVEFDFLKSSLKEFPLWGRVDWFCFFKISSPYFQGEVSLTKSGRRGKKGLNYAKMVL
jgi:hypothetical protein